MSQTQGGDRLTPADRMEILDLYAYYCHCIDSGDGNKWAECFTPDGSLALPHRNQVHRGAGALRGVGDAFPDRTGGMGRHITVNLTLSEDAEGARGRAYLILLQGGWGPSPPIVEMTGRYEDRLVRWSGRWLFASRVLTADARMSGGNDKS